VDGNILALALNMDKRTGKAVLAVVVVVAVVVSVAKILRDRSYLPQGLMRISLGKFKG